MLFESPRKLVQLHAPTSNSQKKEYQNFKTHIKNST